MRMVLFWLPYAINFAEQATKQELDISSELDVGHWLGDCIEHYHEEHDKEIHSQMKEIEDAWSVFESISGISPVQPSEESQVCRCGFVAVIPSSPVFEPRVDFLDYVSGLGEC